MKLNITNIDENCLSSGIVFFAFTCFLNRSNPRESTRRFPSEARANRTSFFPQPAPPLDTKKPANATPRRTQTGDGQIGIARPDRKVAIESGTCQCPSPAPTLTPREMRRRDSPRQIAHPDLLTYFGGRNKSKRLYQQCPENAGSHPETNSEQSLNEQRQSGESGSILSEQVYSFVSQMTCCDFIPNSQISISF
jgi:hypothetical protein